MLRGCVGFSHSEGSWIWYMLIIRGKRSYRLPLIYPLYYVMNALYRRKIRKNLEHYRSFNTDEGIE